MENNQSINLNLYYLARKNDQILGIFDNENDANSALEIARNDLDEPPTIDDALEVLKILP